MRMWGVGGVECECMPVWGLYMGCVWVQCVCVHVFKISK